ncbi:unnamed protein product [Ambrosiozyma monospora]|uniref:Unnamed protein product n=1 Tax=Ambrosiozyma monospora TaxID=43982 RepID=A0ACB5T6F3_AMBMO|nr:unnamed protein product [Ambrosiozyma monospora]
MVHLKIGRIKLDDFDYSKEWVNKSIHRSLDRFKTSYLDVVFLHDVEFVNEDGIFKALTELFELKKQGLVKNVGISGYPVDFLYETARKVANGALGDGVTLDLVMNYSNGCLQNTILADYYDKFFKDTGIKLLNNASILSMSLLRSAETRSFHPCSQDLKDTVAKLAKVLKDEHDTELAELATRFALRLWKGKKGKTVLGLSTLEELDSALIQYKYVLDGSLDQFDAKLVKFSQEFLGDHLNETWKSGINH